MEGAYAAPEGCAGTFGGLIFNRTPHSPPVLSHLSLWGFLWGHQGVGEGNPEMTLDRGNAYKR